MGETYTSGMGFGFLRLNGTIVVREGLSDTVTIQLYGYQETLSLEDSPTIIGLTPGHYAERLLLSDDFSGEVGSDTDGVVETVVATVIEAAENEPFAISDSAAVT